MHTGQETETPLTQALALAGSVTGADLVILDTGVIQTRWGAPDLPMQLPTVRSLLTLPDASKEGPFTDHPLVTHHGLRAVWGVPLPARAGGAAQGTLWLMAKQAHALLAIDCLDRVTGVIAALCDPVREKAQLRSWVSALPTSAVCVVGDTLFANDAACLLTGFEQRDLSTLDTWFSTLYPDNTAEVRAVYEADRAQGFLDARTVPISRHDGRACLVEFNCTTVGRDELWLLSDVTERVASQERFRLLFEQSSTAHVLFDEHGIIDCNPAAVALLGHRAKADLLRLHPKDLSPAVQPDGQRSDEKGEKMESIAFEAGSHRFDWEHRRFDGSVVPVEVTLTPLTLGPRRVLLAEWHDITERLRYEEGLEHARDSALKFARAKADFLATMSHEIRTPMNGVIGMTRLLLDTPLSGPQRDYVETVRACGEGLLALINDILDFSRLDAGKVALERIEFSVCDLLEDALSVVAGTAHEKGLELSSLLGKNVPDRVFGDPTRVRQVMLNLLSNAVKFTTSGEVTVGIDSTKADERGRRVLTISVGDTGPGIAQDALPRLFTAFSQEDTSTTRRFGGSGLGLAICKRLVSLMGGINDVSTSDRGTEFTVTLTFDDAGVEEIPPTLSGHTVLIVDPHPNSRRMLTRLVERTGAKVRKAADLLTATPLISGSDVLLIDHTMQAFGAQQLKAGHRVALITSMVGVSTPGEFALTLPKPIRRKQLFLMLERALVPSGIVALETSSAPPLKFSGIRVLVAEDNVVNQRVIRGLLARFGCSVHIVENGAKALESIAQGPFDLVLMDCQMPELDGLEATRRLRAGESGHRTPVVALTAGVMEGDRERCLAAGMDDFLSKPVRIDELERALATWSALGRRAA